MFGMTNYYSQQYEGEEGDILDERKYPLLPPSGFVGILNYIGTATFCYGQCSIIFPVEESMQDRSQIVNALIYCLLFVWAIYAFVGDFVAILYIHATGGLQSNILLNLPADSVVSLVVSLLMVGVCILSYPLTILPAATMVRFSSSYFFFLYTYHNMHFIRFKILLLILSRYTCSHRLKGGWYQCSLVCRLYQRIGNICLCLFNYMKHR